jgi:hypothetical protein
VKTLGREEFWIAPAASVPIQSRIYFCFVVRRESILREWIPLVAGKFKYAIPVEMDMVGFYNAMATLMAIQIRQLVEESITSFIRLKNFQTSQEITTDNDLRTQPCLLLKSHSFRFRCMRTTQSFKLEAEVCTKT